MKRLLIVFWAHIRCDCYLLFKGMWKGQCHVTMKECGKTILVGAGTSNLREFTFKVNRTFYSTKSSVYYDIERNL